MGCMLKPWSGLGSELLKLFSHGGFPVCSQTGSRAQLGPLDVAVGGK